MRTLLTSAADLPTDTLFAVELAGGALLPRYAPGEVLAIDPTRCPKAGDAVLAKTPRGLGVILLNGDQIASRGGSGPPAPSQCAGWSSAASRPPSPGSTPSSSGRRTARAGAGVMSGSGSREWAIRWAEACGYTWEVIEDRGLPPGRGEPSPPYR